MLCVYLCLSCAYMLYWNVCWGPIMLPIGCESSLYCWDRIWGSRGQVKGTCPFLRVLFFFTCCFQFFFVYQRTVLTSNTTGKGRVYAIALRISASSSSPNEYALSALKCLPVNRFFSSLSLCPGLPPCLWVRRTPLAVAWLVTLKWMIKGL